MRIWNGYYLSPMLYLYLLHSKRRRMRIGSSGNAIENLGETKIRPNPPPHFGTVQIFPSKYNEEDYLQILRRPKYCLPQMRPEQISQIFDTLASHTDLCDGSELA